MVFVQRGEILAGRIPPFPGALKGVMDTSISEQPRQMKCLKKRSQFLHRNGICWSGQGERHPQECTLI